VSDAEQKMKVLEFKGKVQGKALIGSVLIVCCWRFCAEGTAEISPMRERRVVANNQFPRR